MKKYEQIIKNKYFKLVLVLIAVVFCFQLYTNYLFDQLNNETSREAIVEFIYDEMITHIPMAVHPKVRDVLVIGAGDGGVVRELARYPEIEHIDLVEIDELVVEVCKKYLPQK